MPAKAPSRPVQEPRQVLWSHSPNGNADVDRDHDIDGVMLSFRYDEEKFREREQRAGDREPEVVFEVGEYEQPDVHDEGCMTGGNQVATMYIGVSEGKNSTDSVPVDIGDGMGKVRRCGVGVATVVVRRGRQDGADHKQRPQVHGCSPRDEESHSIGPGVPTKVEEACREDEHGIGVEEDLYRGADVCLRDKVVQNVGQWLVLVWPRHSKMNEVHHERHQSHCTVEVNGC